MNSGIENLLGEAHLSNKRFSCENKNERKSWLTKGKICSFEVFCPFSYIDHWIEKSSNVGKPFGMSFCGERNDCNFYCLYLVYNGPRRYVGEYKIQ